LPEPDDAMFPLREFLGMSIGRADGHASAVMEIDARHLNRNGVAHGAALFPLIDTVMGAATVGPVEPSSSTVCSEGISSCCCNPPPCTKTQVARYFCAPVSDRVLPAGGVQTGYRAPGAPRALSGEAAAAVVAWRPTPRR
jgi:acyl-coenzyme A thioesterase PaaI-like protein